MKTRTVELLQRISVSEYPIKAETLATDFNVSQRTIRTEILEANEWLISKGLPEILTIRNKGFFLKLTAVDEKTLKMALLNLKGDLLNRKERTFDIVLAIAYGKNPVYLNRKEEEFQISKSTMDEDMRRLRADLLKYGIEIVSYGRQGLSYKGSERSIRTMIYDLINQNLDMIGFSMGKDPQVTPVQKIFNKYIDLNDIKKLDEIYSSKRSKQENDIYKNQILLFTLIWLQRVKRHELISAVSWKNGEFEDNSFSDFIDKIIKEFQLEDVPQVERNYICFTIETFNTRDISNTLEWVQAQLLTIQMIQFVENETHIPFHLKEEMLWESLYKHMAALIIRIKNDVQVFNPLKENIRINYFPIYRAVSQFIPTLEEVVGGKVIEDERAFLVIHFSTVASAINRDLTYIYKSVVVCNHGLATGNLLAENLKEKFPQIEIVAVLSSKEVELVDKLDVDLIFSTFKLAYSNKPVLVIDPILTEANSPIVEDFLRRNDELQRLEANGNESTELFTKILSIVEESGGRVDRTIYSKLETLFEKKNLEINKREIQPMLKDILTDNHIMIKEKAATWNEAIERTAKPLVKENIIEKRYVDAMIHAVEEYGPYIVIGKHLALAHARPEDGANKLGLSVATIDQPIHFGNPEMDPVKIIFCLAAVDSYSHLTIMKELIELINDESKLNQLIDCTTIASFKQLLFSKKEEG
ncbi:BglG family transcription antiterminator [Candidatus Enterococcus clewellii]|uniref:PTS system ascorbate-specific transporter subunit IIA n=1 Tax=Candidatus Enterococcus clewellii TaxID=1834193 RepID=A0A242K602_9ENTE|nr:PTS sugar transporter subunit IIA [Enterococcus sp. 9E7_DIV0242]OTP14346.1 PTS system ascorbate-specific transporter subunit IIA [Enterococcus sp. 9E7_DIV0242]